MLFFGRLRTYDKAGHELCDDRGSRHEPEHQEDGVVWGERRDRHHSDGEHCGHL